LAQISSSSEPDSYARPGVVGEPAGEDATARAAGLATAAGQREAAPLAVAPEAVGPGLRPAEADCSYSCGGAGGADAPATAPGRGPESAPVQTGASSILSSCLYFLALYSRVHGFPTSTVSWRTLRIPCLSSSPDGSNQNCCGKLSQRTEQRTNCTGAVLRTQFTRLPRGHPALHAEAFQGSFDYRTHSWARYSAVVDSSGNALPILGAFAACGLKWNEPVGEISLLAASLLSPFPVARVSRFIDTSIVQRGVTAGKWGFFVISASSKGIT